MIKYLLAILLLAGCASPGGIGVLYNSKGVVKYVFDKSPAQQAGIMLEDTILNTKDLRGPVGSICIVKYVRDCTTLLCREYEVYIKRADVNTFRSPNYGTWSKK